MSDLISRQAAIDIERNATVDTNPSHFEAHQKFTQFMDDAEISSFGRWQWSNGFNTALTAVGIDLKKLPSAQPEPKWIPVTTRPMTDEERVYYEGYYGHLCENEAVMFDCPMPDDEQEVWVCSDCGNVWQDACVVDIGIGLEGNGDWLDIVAWMPYEKPQPYSEGKENR